MEDVGVCPRCGTAATQSQWCQMCGLDLKAEPQLPSAEEYLALRRDRQWRDAHRTAAPALSRVPVAAWVAVGCVVAMLAGGLGPWATAFGIVSINGTRGDGWIVIAMAGVGIAALVLWLRRRERWWLVVTLGLAGLVGAGVAAADLHEVRSAGPQDFFGEKLSLVTPAWGLYAALAGSALLVLTSVVLLVDATRDRRSVALRAVVGVLGALAALTAAGSVVIANGVADDRGSTADGSASQHVDTTGDDTAGSGASSDAATPTSDASTDQADAPTSEADPAVVTNDEIQTVLDEYAAAYDSEDAEALRALFADGFRRRAAGEPTTEREEALAVYRRQFNQLDSPAYVLSHMEVREATENGAAADARYSITSQNGTVRGSITFHLVRQDGQLLIGELDVEPD